jgi:LCP family protein required for cell wall assembly
MVNLLVALSLVSAVGAYGYVRYRLGGINKVNVGGLASHTSGPLTLLIVGSDTRALKGPGNAGYGSASETPGQRSDTIMLARVVPASHTVTLLSIPRDLLVNIQGIGETRINAAFNNGPNLLVSTIKHDLGIPINHFVEVNFDSFKDITDAVGGVKFYFPTPVKDVYSNLYVPAAGCVNLTGNQALGFARSRHYEYEVDGQWETQGLSDLARIQRQQAFVKKMISKAESKFTNPIALNDIIGSVTRNLTVDKGFSTSLMLSLAEDLRHADVAGIPTETLPANGEVVGGADVLALQQPQAQQMIAAFNTLGTTVPKQTTTGTTLPDSHVAVEVANGSGTPGQAARAAAALTRLGYKMTVTNQSPGYNFTDSDIEYAPSAKAAAEQLQRQLSGTATLTESSSLTPTPYRLELITGADYAGVANGQHPTTTTHKTKTHKAKTRRQRTRRATAPPSTTTTTYLLPGPQPTPSELASC